MTIVGPPGVGKTRFAEEVIAQSPPQRVSVSCWLGDARTERALCRLVARALGLPVSSSGRVASFAGKISDRLVGRLLLLDQADALDEQARALVGRWTEREGVSVLSTARESLHLLGERVFSLGPLAFDLGSVRPRERGPAVDMLCALLHGSQIDVRRPELLSALTKIAAAVDGVPLALELVAPQIASAGVEFVLAKLKSESRPT